jgi:hypothetical protein
VAELVRLGADGIGCADADGDAPVTVAAAHGGAQGWEAVAAILECEAARMAVPEPSDADAASVCVAPLPTTSLLRSPSLWGKLTPWNDCCVASWTRWSEHGAPATDSHSIPPHLSFHSH